MSSSIFDVAALYGHQPQSVLSRRVMVILKGDGFESLLRVIHAPKLQIGGSEVAQIIDVGRINLISMDHSIDGFVELMKPQFVLAQARVHLISSQVELDGIFIDLHGALNLPHLLEG